MRKLTFFAITVAVLGWMLLPCGKLSASNSSKALAFVSADDVTQQDGTQEETTDDTSTGEDDKGDQPDDQVTQPVNETDKLQTPAVSTFDQNQVELPYAI